MPSFTYRALQSDGESIEGELQARHRAEALRVLAGRGLQIRSLDAAGEGAGVGEGRRKGEARGRRASRRDAARDATASAGGIRLSRSQVILFSEELADLLGAGIQLEPALKLIEGRGERSELRDLAGYLRERVRDGRSLAQALEQASPSFGDLYCHLVSAGELSGSLEPILRRQVRYLTTMQELRAKVVTAMVYPAFLVVAGIAVATLFVTFLIPKLSMMIESTGGPPPAGVAVIVAISAFLRAYGWILLAGGLLLLVVLRQLARSEAYRPTWERMQLKLPLFGPLQLARFHVTFLETLGNVLANGLPLLRGLQLAEGTAENRYLRTRLAEVAERVADGASLYRALERSELFPAALIDMVRIGEQTGSLPETLSRAGERYDRELERRMERIGAFIQPVIILVMALLVGVMAYFMITVIYDTIGVLRSR